jgi:hypothetical protein
MLFLAQAKWAVTLLRRYASKNRSRPKREASRCLAGEVASKASAGAEGYLDCAVLLLFAFGSADVVHPPP